MGQTILFGLLPLILAWLGYSWLMLHVYTNPNEMDKD